MGIDILHVLHLGVLRDLCGSCIKVLLRKRGYYSGSKLGARFRQFTRDLRIWAKATKTKLQLKRVKKSTVNWKSDACPELHAKGADVGTILKFLCWKTQQKSPPEYQGMTACLWAASNMVGLLMTSGVFMTGEERETGYFYGSLFLSSYLSLANEAIAADVLLWKIRPKYHFLCHVISDLNDFARNQAKLSTWIDEDGMKHALRMMRMMISSTSPVNMLKRWTVIAKAAMDKHTV